MKAVVRVIRWCNPSFLRTYEMESTCFPSHFDGNTEAFGRVICSCNAAYLRLYGIESTRAGVLSFYSMRLTSMMMNKLKRGENYFKYSALRELITWTNAFDFPSEWETERETLEMAFASEAFCRQVTPGRHRRVTPLDARVRRNVYSNTRRGGRVLWWCLSSRLRRCIQPRLGDWNWSAAC